jgi:phage shock protein A
MLDGIFKQRIKEKSMIVDILIGVVVVVFLGIILNKRAMKKIGATLSAMLGKGADKAMEIDPVAVYKDRIEKAAGELKGAMDLLEEHSALIKKLKRKLETHRNEYAQTETWAKKLLNEGQQEGAEKYANLLVSLEESIEKTQARLESSEKTYKLQTEKIKKLKDQIVEFKEKSGRLSADLQTSKAEAKISELTQKFDSTSLGFDDLKEIEDVIQGQIDKNESKTTVAQDLSSSDPKVEMANELKSQKAKDILEKLKAK